MKAGGTFFGLTFDWPRAERFPFFLFGCVFVSLAAHVGTFFIFQVIYPQRVTIPPPAPQISLLSPTNPQHQGLLRWIDAEDPALVASASSVTPPGLFEVPYQPSFVKSRTALRPAVPKPEPLVLPPVRSPLAIIQSVETRAAVPLALAPPPPTAIRFTAALAGRSPREISVFSWRARAPTTVTMPPLKLLIGVSAEGEVRFTFIEESCGYEPLDLEAAAQLERLRFSPSAASMTWGFATFSWGTDAYATPAPSSAKP